MVTSLMASMKALVWISLLLLVVIYTSALFMMAAVEDHKYDKSELNPLFFHTLGQSMITMFNICIQAQWTEIIQPTYEHQGHVAIVLIMYVFITTLAILNLVIGVITERTMEAKAEFDKEEETRQKKALMRNISEMADAIYSSKDCDEDGLGMAEMVSIVHDRPELKALLKTCGLPRGFHIGNLHLIFDETYGGTVDKLEFLNGMSRLIFNNEFQRDCCTLLTVAQVKEEVKHLFTELKKDMSRNFFALQQIRSAVTNKAGEEKEAAAETAAETVDSAAATPPTDSVVDPNHLAQACDAAARISIDLAANASTTFMTPKTIRSNAQLPMAAANLDTNATLEALARSQEALQAALRQHMQALLGGPSTTSPRMMNLKQGLSPNQRRQLARNVPPPPRQLGASPSQQTVLGEDTPQTHASRHIADTPHTPQSSISPAIIPVPSTGNDLQEELTGYSDTILLSHNA